MATLERTDALRDALQAELSRSEISATELGKSIGRGPDYIRDFLNGRKKSLGASEITAIESRLGLDAGRLLRVLQVGAEAIAAARPEPNVRPAPSAPAFSRLGGRGRNVPVHGIAVGGEDADFRLNGETVDRVQRPPGLANVKDLYALYVSNESMYPAFKHNALIYVNPHKPPSIGDDVVIELHSEIEGEPGPGFLKRLKARTPTKIVVEQFNPPKDIEFDRERVKSMHRVVPWEEALGL